MATILEGAAWTVTEEVADHMVENGLLVKCEKRHADQDLLITEMPVYHIACDAPRWFGFSTLGTAIESAMRTVENAREASEANVEDAGMAGMT